MGILEAIILGIIQGLTEFLPVSSSGHLELGKALFGEDGVPQEGLLFSVVLHAATALSTIVVYRKAILELFKGLFKFKWNDETKYVSLIAVSMIPVGVIGFAFESQIELLFTANLPLVGAMLLVTSALLFFTHFSKVQKGRMTFGKSFIIGISQAIAILPGISRSGSTIATALLLGISKEKAAKFSFLMVLPPILGMAALKFKDYLEAPINEVRTDSTAMICGFIAAFIAGLAACTWMIKIVKKAKLSYFAIYCAIAGLFAIVYGTFILVR
ncbi:MAG: undecaprenyl-diphosphate phosphatase [Flavobacteriales bacterium]